jgi:hypothetical protein
MSNDLVSLVIVTRLRASMMMSVTSTGEHDARPVALDHDSAVRSQEGQSRMIDVVRRLPWWVNSRN